MLGAIRAIAASERIDGAVFIASPANSLGMLWVNWKLFAISIRHHCRNYRVTALLDVCPADTPELRGEVEALSGAIRR